MTFSKTSFFFLISVGIVLNGCSVSRFKSNNQGNVSEIIYPVQQMSISENTQDLLGSYSLESERDGDSAYGRSDSYRDEQMANFELPNRAINLFPASISGVWNLSMGGKTCRIATPQTKFGQGYRASPLHCSGIVSLVKSWSVKEKKLYFYDNSGRIVVALYSYNTDHFEGRTLDGYTVILSR
ncbi:AprI/Inh family metalloprotease inhibitor [Bartonella sp. B41]